jgi:hypothetical protein
MHFTIGNICALLLGLIFALFFEELANKRARYDAKGSKKKLEKYKKRVRFQILALGLMTVSFSIFDVLGKPYVYLFGDFNPTRALFAWLFAMIGFIGLGYYDELAHYIHSRNPNLQISKQTLVSIFFIVSVMLVIPGFFIGMGIVR